VMAKVPGSQAFSPVPMSAAEGSGSLSTARWAVCGLKPRALD
jgi:hypothetical protein